MDGGVTMCFHCYQPSMIRVMIRASGEREVHLEKTTLADLPEDVCEYLEDMTKRLKIGKKAMAKIGKIKIIKAGKGDPWISGYVEGLKAYAWWKDGVQYVGSCGTTLNDAIKRAEEDYGKGIIKAEQEMRGDGETNPSG